MIRSFFSRVMLRCPVRADARAHHEPNLPGLRPEFERSAGGSPAVWP
jgi:hypothetical protein